MPGRELKAVLVCSSDPDSTAGFSGTLHSAYQALLSKFGEVQPIHVGPMLKIVNKLTGAHKRLTGRSGQYYFHPLFSVLAARWVEHKIRRAQPDIVICAAASSVFAHVRTNTPSIYFSDATFAAMTRLYPAWRNLPAWNSRAGNQVEKLCLDNAAAVIMSSEWAKKSAEADYDALQEKIAVLPYGPNLRQDLLPSSEPPLLTDPSEELQILYVGFDWLRKGGDFALAVTEALNRKGCKARLNIVGRAPEGTGSSPCVTHHGLINKDTPGDPERMAEIYRKSHLFLLPTIADATPVVFSEAAAFALPSITFDVGGVASAVKHGLSGLVFPPDATPDKVAGQIAALVADVDRLKALRRTSFAWSQETANWGAWADAVVAMALRLCGRQPDAVDTGVERAEGKAERAFSSATIKAY